MNWTDREDFAVFILTHGRAEKVDTVKMMRDKGYKGRIVLVIDNEDEQGNLYRRKYGDDVVVFDKKFVARYVDVGDNLQKRNVVVFARNVVYSIAKQMGYRYIVVLDDDYSDVQLRYTNKERSKLGGQSMKNICPFIDVTMQFLVDSGALAVAWAQNGDSIGGIGNIDKKGLLRFKVMNLYCFDVERPMPFMGRLNEDLTASVMAWKNGLPVFTIRAPEVHQQITQTNSGGLTDSYLEVGTYVKSFYSVMYRPDCVKVSVLPSKHARIHHRVDWKLCCPMILSQEVKK